MVVGGQQPRRIGLGLPSMKEGGSFELIPFEMDYGAHVGLFLFAFAHLLLLHAFATGGGAF